LPLTFCGVVSPSGFGGARQAATESGLKRQASFEKERRAMKRLPVCVTFLCVLTAATSALAQNSASDTSAGPEDTPAYRMLNAREGAARAELEKLLTIYRPLFPGVRSKQFEWDLIRRKAAKMLLIAPERLSRLSAEYGEMTLRWIALEVEVRDALTIYKPRHPVVREKLSALSRAEREALEHPR
jgi:hypothetical protein